ncbi:hypothetical protein COCCADRAFT_112884, partial [Bipolaris zeicola 26-R-13]
YLTLDEEKAIVRFLLLMSSLGHPVRIKYNVTDKPVGQASESVTSPTLRTSAGIYLNNIIV